MATKPGPPPGAAQLAALGHRQATITQLSPTNIDDIKAALAHEHCVSFSIPVFNIWYLNTAIACSGDITMPIPGEVCGGGHAMCSVGYIDDPAIVSVQYRRRTPIGMRRSATGKDVPCEPSADAIRAIARTPMFPPPERA